MLTPNIVFKNFNNKKKNIKLKKLLIKILNQDNSIIKSLGKGYKLKFIKSKIIKYKKFKNFRIIGMGGSSLGAQAIYDFLKNKIKKNFIFIDNLKEHEIIKKQRYLNLIISKSGNTLETIVNANIILKKHHKNIFITEDKPSYLSFLAQKLKADIIHHNNYIGGRYSVLSEVGMLPAELMGLNTNKFKQLNYLIKNKKFLQNLILNVASIIENINKKKFNSIIINYEQDFNSLLYWYQQLVAESLGKKNKGILPMISNMPKDNHSLMQNYLDGCKNNFFTFFYYTNKKSLKINSKEILNTHSFLKNKSINQILLAQKNATENIFIKKNIPFRTFEIKSKNEKTLGELFTFFILETILLGLALKINPYDQPSVELIKRETKKLLI